MKNPLQRLVVRMKIKKKSICKFENLLDKIDKDPFLYTHINPRDESTLFGKNVMTTKLESGREIAMFYDMTSCFVCLKDNGRWFDVANNPRVWDGYAA